MERELGARSLERELGEGAWRKSFELGARSWERELGAGIWELGAGRGNWERELGARRGS